MKRGAEVTALGDHQRWQARVDRLGQCFDLRRIRILDRVPGFGPESETAPGR